MHGNRRRKKRPSYGVRTVEINKGQNGFGFTISGQAPCILSCIVPGSPAEKVGLRPGDYLIAVNGQNVSKAPHDDVVRVIGQSKLLKLQIAENYYSDSSDDEFTVNRPKPKYPNRLRHKHQQTRAEKVVRELQSGAIFNEHAAVHNSENNPLSDREWTDSYPAISFVPTSSAYVSATMNGIVHNPPTPSSSPTRLRPDQIRLVMAEARHAARNARPVREEAPVHPLRVKQTPKKRDKILKTKSPISHLQQSDNQPSVQRQYQKLPSKQKLLMQNQNFQYQNMHNNNRQHLHKLQHPAQKPKPPNALFQQQSQQSYQESVTPAGQNHAHQTFYHQQFQHENSQLIKAYQQLSVPQIAQHIRQQQTGHPIGPLKLQDSELYQLQMNEANIGASDPGNCITEQEINSILYPTLAELQQGQVSPSNTQEAIYRAIVGYLGTIEMPKEPQGGSRLTAIRNCIRRLRIEKKVHTLVMMSVFSEQVVLTNPHGLTLAEYPAERITFCGVYADDKKFFGLVTVHGMSSDEISEGSQDEGDTRSISVSSSCHVFMVDPNAIQHPDHCRRAKAFCIECTPAPVQEDGIPYCQEFPESADPILHAIMSLYRNRVGFHLDIGAPGLIDVDAQMSPQHSNTSSNSSNSDSGIGFKDEGGHHYHNSDRVFVVEFDDNQRTRLQTTHFMGNRVVDGENLRPMQDVTASNTLNNGCTGEASDSSLPSTSVRKPCEKMVLTSNVRPSSCDNTRMHSQERSKGKENKRPTMNMNCHSNESISHTSDENSRVTVFEQEKIAELKKRLLGSFIILSNGRTSTTEEVGIHDNIPRGSSDLPRSVTPGRECTSPHDGDRLTVRAMPDPISFERSPGFFPGGEFPIQVASMRHSMHKYLQHKQEHLVKVSQKINRRESDSGIPNPLSVRAFSPPTGKQTPMASLKNIVKSQQCSTLELSLKLSPKVFGVPFHPSAPSEHSFTRSLEDLRDSSTSDGVVGSLGISGGSFRDGSESDHGLTRLLHASETNLVRCGPREICSQGVPRGAFRAVYPRPHRYPVVHLVPVQGMPRVGQLSDISVMGSTGTIRGISCLRGIGSFHRSVDSGDENTETTENTGGQGGSQDVHPPTQDEFSHDSDSEQVEGNEGKKHRGVSLRRLSRSRLANERPAPTSDSNATQSDTELGKISGPAIRISNGGLSNDTSVEMSRVGVWASSFEKLIDDPAGLHTFAEFLKKEYSHENIYFWTACERYKMIEDDEERRQVARTIFNRHLGVGAPEPVNVDSQARQVAQEGLADPDEFLFSAAQKQIYNLMKFDSYSRFLKSDLYNSCLSQERKGLPLPFPGDDTLDPDLGIFSDSNFYKHLKKSRSDADERRRKSLLPWHRKDRSKSKDRGEAEYWRRKKLGHHSTSESSSARSDLTDSHTSLNSSDFAPGRRAISKESLTSADAISLSGAEGFSLCRFFLPDQSNSVVAVRSGETVKELVRQLLERRRINFTAFNVVLVKEDKMVDVNKDSAVLRGKEARVERMVLFSLFLPSRKTVYVKAKPHKLISEVLKPILTKYGLKIELMVIFKSGATKGINLKSTVTDFDGEKLIIQTKEEIKEWSDPARQSKRNSNLDEITNRVFEDLLNGKTQSSFDDLGVLDFDARSIKTDPTSETSSSLLESFSRRESLSLERNPESKPSGSRRVLQNSGMSKLRNNHDLTARTRQENADLYEGLKRAQMSRLDDQRGTEINFELPDFLKTDSNPGGSLLSHFERSFHSTASDSIHQNEFLSRAHPEVWGGHPCSSADTTLVSPPDLDLDDLEETLRPSSDMVKASADTEKENRLGGGDNNANSRQDVTPSPFPFSRNHVSSPSPFLTPPPPLPPKPKLGGPLRGPPPRPPSRQPTPLSHALHLLDNHDHLINHSRQSLDKFSVSFV